MKDENEKHNALAIDTATEKQLETLESPQKLPMDDEEKEEEEDDVEMESEEFEKPNDEEEKKKKVGGLRKKLPDGMIFIEICIIYWLDKGDLNSHNFKNTVLYRTVKCNNTSMIKMVSANEQTNISAKIK